MLLFLNPQWTHAHRDATWPNDPDRKVLSRRTLEIAQTMAGCFTDPHDLTFSATHAEIAERAQAHQSQVNHAIMALKQLDAIESIRTGRAAIYRWSRGVLVTPVGMTPSDQLAGRGPRIAVMLNWAFPASHWATAGYITP